MTQSFEYKASFNTIEELNAFTARLNGGVGVTGGVSAPSAPAQNFHAGPTHVVPEIVLTPAQKAQETKRRNAELKAAQTTVAGATQAPSTLGADPFAIGQAPSLNVPGLQSQPPVAPPYVAPAAPVSAPIAPPAPVVQQAADPASPRGQYDAACIAIMNQVKNAGMNSNDFGQLMIGSLQQVGATAKDKVTTITDDQMSKFYHILKAGADAFLATVAPAAPAQNFV